MYRKLFIASGLIIVLVAALASWPAAAQMPKSFPAVSASLFELGRTMRLLPNELLPSALAASPMNPTKSNPLFHEAPQYPAVPLATYIASGDFNGDGFPDVAVVAGGDLGGSSVQVLINRGDGSFEPPVTYLTGTGVTSIAVGDFNDDGNLDLVVATGGYQNVSIGILLGNGNGTFGPQTVFFQNQAGAQVAVGDFNNDGNLDLVTFAASQANDVAVLLGNGDGTFQVPMYFPTSGSRLYGLQVGDFNNDGNLDIITSDAESPARVGVLLGNGHGSFQAPLTTDTPTELGLVVADFNHDGKLDIAVAAGPTTVRSGIAILSGKGDGTFDTSFIEYPTENSVISLAVADLNGDGLPDIIAGGFSNSITAILNKGNGKFTEPTTYFGVGVGGMVTGDFNGDGKADIVTTDSSGGAVDVLIGDGTGKFGARNDLAMGSGPTGVVAGDFNGDGIVDLASSTGINVVSVFLGKGNAKFQEGQDSVVGLYPAALAAADFNGDGKLDLAVANGSGTVSILFNNGDGTFRPQVSYPAGDLPASIAVGDFNGDGRPDIAVVNAVCPLFGESCGTTGSLSILLNNGDGTFSPQVQYPLGYLPNSVVTGDFNGDGKLDLAVAVACGDALYCNAGGMISVFPGKGDGTFGAPSNFGVGGGRPAAVVVGDFNGDGFPDLAAANYFDGTVDVLLNNGKGKFSLESEYIAGGRYEGFPQAIYVGDFNGDGRADIAMANNCGNVFSIYGNYCQGPDSGSVGVLLNVGGGHFQHAQPYQYGVGWNPVSLVAGDFNGDGKLDIVTANLEGESLSILLNNSNAPSQPAAISHAANGLPGRKQ